MIQNLCGESTLLLPKSEQLSDVDLSGIRFNDQAEFDRRPALVVLTHRMLARAESFPSEDVEVSH
jgi:hypothetical protein